MRKVGCALMVVTLFAGAAAASPGLPRVGVRFAFEASMYQTNEDLGDAGRKKVGDAAVRAFIAEAMKFPHFPFIEWTADDPNAQHRLIIALTEHPAGRDEQVDLVLRGSISNNSVNAATIVLYKWTDGKHANDADRLALDVTNALVAHVEDIRSTFALRVPVATAVKVDDGIEGVVVDVPAALLRADTKVSTLAVSFVGRVTPLQTTMTLKEPSPYGSTKIGCKIQQFDFGGLKLDEQHGWSPLLPSVFSPATVRVLAVTFENYKYSDTFVVMNDQ